MISIDICLEENTIAELASKLECIASMIESGYTSGYGWNLSGNEESEDDDDYETEEEVTT